MGKRDQDKRAPKAGGSPHLREVRTGGSPEGRRVKIGGDPASTETQTICWQAARMDMDHPLWGWSKLTPKTWFRQILPFLKSIEGLTWAQLKSASGGRSNGTNHHALEVEGCTNGARVRLAELRLDDYDEIFSLRLSNTVRIYGLRDGRALRIIWHDPYHGQNSQAIYPVRQR